MDDETFYVVDAVENLEAPGTWLGIEGGRLSQRIYIQISKAGGRRYVSAIHMQNDHEIRGSDLRFPIARIGEAIIRSYTTEEPNFPDPHQMGAFRLAIKNSDHPNALIDAIAERAVPRPARGRGATPPSEEELLEFAALYMREFEAKAHGAMTRATGAYGMDRTTGYRWLDRCRALGLLPPEENA